MTCRWCQYRTGWWGWLDTGPGWVSDRSLRFADYRGLDEPGLFPSLSGRLHYRDAEGRYLDLRAEDLGTDARRLGVQGGVRGRYQLELRHQAIPKYRAFGAQSPFSGAGGRVLGLPPDWVFAPVTGGLARLADTSKPLVLSTLRKTTGLSFRWRSGGRWVWSARAERDTQQGTRAFGAGVFTLNTAHLPAPVDQATDRVGVTLQFQNRKTAFQAGLTGSWFDNGATSLTWDNPFTAVGGATRLRAALAPDNRALTLRLSLAHRFTARLRASATAQLGQAEQHDNLLPYTINPEIPQQPLPRSRLQGRIDARYYNLAGRLAWRPSNGLDLVLRLHTDERDNRTPVVAWNPVVTDLVVRPDTLNRPYSFHKRKADLEARYRLPHGWRVRGGVGRESVERSLQSVERTVEDSAWLEAAASPWLVTRLRVKLERGRRDASPYTTSSAPGLPENPLMRKYNLADRDRDRLAVDFGVTPSSGLDINFAWFASQDHYRDSPLGLQEGSMQSFNLDLTVDLGDGFNATGFVGLDRVEADIRSSQNGTADWLGASEDRFLTWGVGFRWPVRAGLAGRLDYLRSRSEGAVRVGGGVEEPFPDLSTSLANLKASLVYSPGAHWDLRLIAEYERYHARDWQWDGLGMDGIPAVLSLGASSPDDAVLALRLLARYRFE